MALGALWALFFSPTDRPKVDSVAVGSRLAIDVDRPQRGPEPLQQESEK
jgi:hypothetical protein